jgi:hypothetical protein
MRHEQGGTNESETEEFKQTNRIKKEIQVDRHENYIHPIY